jgi:arylsulfatase A-like enzyme
LCGCGIYRSHIDRNGNPDWWRGDKLVPQEGYATSLVTEHAVRFIESHRDQPFFLYVAHLAIHFPWMTPQDEGFRKVGGSYLKPTPGPDCKLGPHTPKQLEPVVRRMIEELDVSVGEIVSALRRLRLERRTLVVFTSDNGGYLSYSGGWKDISSNGLCRGQKGQLYEGGHRVPAVFWWPGQITPGSTTDATAMTMDVFPTCLELAGVEFPPNDSPNGLDGVSLAPLLLENKPLPERTLFWRMRGQKAVRRGPWKLVVQPDGKAELYNLADDLGETRNLAAKHAEVVDRLLDELARWEALVKRKTD